MKPPLRGLWGLAAAPIAAVVCVNALVAIKLDEAENKLFLTLFASFIMVGLSFISGWLARQDLEGP